MRINGHNTGFLQGKFIAIDGLSAIENFVDVSDVRNFIRTGFSVLKICWMFCRKIKKDRI